MSGYDEKYPRPLLMREYRQDRCGLWGLRHR
jgi:hypothetical protein